MCVLRSQDADHIATRGFNIAGYMYVSYLGRLAADHACFSLELAAAATWGRSRCACRAACCRIARAELRGAGRERRLLRWLALLQLLLPLPVHALCLLQLYLQAAARVPLALLLLALWLQHLPVRVQVLVRVRMVVRLRRKAYTAARLVLLRSEAHAVSSLQRVCEVHVPVRSLLGGAAVAAVRRCRGRAGRVIGCRAVLR